MSPGSRPAEFEANPGPKDARRGVRRGRGLVGLMASETSPSTQSGVRDIRRETSSGDSHAAVASPGTLSRSSRSVRNWRSSIRIWPNGRAQDSTTPVRRRRGRPLQACRSRRHHRSVPRRCPDRCGRRGGGRCWRWSRSRPGWAPRLRSGLAMTTVRRALVDGSDPRHSRSAKFRPVGPTRGPRRALAGKGLAS